MTLQISTSIQPEDVHTHNTLIMGIINFQKLCGTLIILELTVVASNADLYILRGGLASL